MRAVEATASRTDTAALRVVKTIATDDGPCGLAMAD